MNHSSAAPCSRTLEECIQSLSPGLIFRYSCLLLVVLRCTFVRSIVFTSILILTSWISRQPHIHQRPEQGTHPPSARRMSVPCLSRSLLCPCLYSHIYIKQATAQTSSARTSAHASPTSSSPSKNVSAAPNAAVLASSSTSAKRAAPSAR
jgi:hypothetical protein